jgi:hypothetical protein
MRTLFSLRGRCGYDKGTLIFDANFPKIEELPTNGMFVDDELYQIISKGGY